MEHGKTGVCRAGPELVVCMNSQGFLQQVPGNASAGIMAPLKSWRGDHSISSLSITVPHSTSQHGPLEKDAHDAHHWGGWWIH